MKLFPDAKEDPQVIGNSWWERLGLLLLLM